MINPLNNLLKLSNESKAFASDSNSSLSALDFAIKVKSYSQSMGKIGLSRGDRLAILMPNSVEAVALITACFDSGVSAIPLNTKLNEEDLKYQIDIAKCKALVSDNDKLPALSSHIQFIRQSEFKESEPVEKLDLKDWNSQNEACVIFTSGSSSKPKGVIHSIESLFNAASNSSAATGFDQSREWLIALPLSHIAGMQMLARSLVTGASMRVINDASSEAIINELDIKPADIVPLVPTQLWDIFEKRRADFINERINTILLGGAPSGDKLLEAMKSLTTSIISCYGMTEVGAHVTCLRLSDKQSAISSVGRAIPNAHIEIRDHNNQLLANQSEGQIWINTNQMATAYLNSDGSTTPLDSWFQTGDIGYFDDVGNLTITGRQSSMLISGGENISVNEIENIIRECPAVVDCAVVGVPDIRWGERPVAFVVLAEKASVVTVENYVAEKLSTIKKPDHMISLNSLPLTCIGKVDYQRLKSNALQEIAAD